MQSRVLYIDKGSNDGIKTDMAVITPAGIVGKIVQVFPDSSQVLPINDQFSGVGAALKDSRLQGILKGAANGATTLQYIMSDEKVVPGEEVITSGGDRIFPKGLPVGRGVSVEPGKDLFLNIRVVPSSRLDQLEEVLVVTKITEKMPDSKDLGPLRASDILAERLPTVPTKTDVDAAGNPKPGAATPARTRIGYFFRRSSCHRRGKQASHWLRRQGSQQVGGYDHAARGCPRDEFRNHRSCEGEACAHSSRRHDCETVEWHGSGDNCTSNPVRSDR